MGETDSGGGVTFPRLDAGVTGLATDDDLRGPLHALVCDHLLGTDGHALWVDSGGHATTAPLARIAPGERFLDRVRVARGFTACQHAALLDALGGSVDDDTALVVCPAVDLLYREGEVVGHQPRAFLERAVERLVRAAGDRPVLVSWTEDDHLTAPLRAALDRELRYEATRFGPRFSGESFETLAYGTGGYDAGGGVQTTLAFWARLVRRRRDALGAGGTAGRRTQPGVSAGGAD